ncbi:DUF2306 domain-containing protein [Actinoplanes sp. KI2]|uniref:DUF2306 domain-containing protein n=1 Tax=Actinoplanes sp. KI2 TaxID=2983315 RepID=UPI0021D585AD|nr:DUF2306 domain-containing protein [Actinoplanes sp. KI2]MCU7731040.1 DUF2306 domain-containing protein [Actinoplanes sp. KI2]
MNSRRSWLIPTGLIALTNIPSLGGAARLSDLAANGAVTADNARFHAMPLPVVLHIVAALIYCFAGAFQFAPRFRRRHPRWHRASGWVLVPAGLMVAVSGVWMTLTYAFPPPDGLAVKIERLIVGPAMFAAIILAIVAVRGRNIAAHRAWMIRAYALAQGAGTQALTQLPWILLVGPTGTVSRAVLMGAAWLINVLVAEWIIRRHPMGSGSPRTRRPVPAGARRVMTGVR